MKQLGSTEVLNHGQVCGEIFADLPYYKVRQKECCTYKK